MNNAKGSHAISGVFVFLLLGVFSVFSTVMVLMAAKAYRGTVERAETHNSARTASAYIRTMLRSNDEAGTLRLEESDEIQTITLINTYEDESYVTRIYAFEGMLREWFSGEDMEFEPHGGEPVCEADSLQAEYRDGLLTIMVTANGEETEIRYAPRVRGDE